MNYLVDIDKFYGPLDLLLYLLDREEMDIYDIPIALIADQYIDFIESTGLIDLDNIGEFLIMASYLLNLKSRMLLPEFRTESSEEPDISDPREELINRILEYRQFKLAGEYLANRYDDLSQRVFFRPGPGYLDEYTGEISSSLGLLIRAWMSVQYRNMAPDYQLPDRDLDVAAKIEDIIKRLPPGGEPVAFQGFFAGNQLRREFLAYFLALLELVRLQKVEAIQEHRFGEIKVCLQVGNNNVDAS